MLIDSDAITLLIRQKLMLAEGIGDRITALALREVLKDIAHVENQEMQRTVESLDRN